jgi:hypothetical protein
MHNLLMANESFENVAEFKFWGNEVTKSKLRL